MSQPKSIFTAPDSFSYKAGTAKQAGSPPTPPPPPPPPPPLPPIYSPETVTDPDLLAPPAQQLPPRRQSKSPSASLSPPARPGPTRAQTSDGSVFRRPTFRSRSNTPVKPSGSTASVKRPSGTRPVKAEESHLQKRLRREISEPAISLHTNFQSSLQRRPPLQSPLFFSNSPPSRPQIPPRLSSSEAGAKMLSRAQGEDTSIKTVTLARGIFAPNSPTTPQRPGIRSRPSEDRFSHLSLSDHHSPDTPARSEASKWLNHSGIAELLEQDVRPAFIVDLADMSNYEDEGLKMIYANPSLRSQLHTMSDVLGNLLQNTDNLIFQNTSFSFKQWLLGYANNGELLERSVVPYEQKDHSWTFSTVRKRLRTVSGVSKKEPVTQTFLPYTPPVPVLSHTSPPPSETPLSIGAALHSPGLDEGNDQDYFGSVHAPPLNVSDDPSIAARELNGRSSSEEVSSMSTRPSAHSSLSRSRLNAVQSSDHLYSSDALLAAVAGNVDSIHAPVDREVGFFDWTRLPVSDSLPKHIQFTRSIDWAATALGPIETWSADLRQMCNLVMASPHPAAFYWGDDLIAIYNEAYVLLAGQKHPTLMGQSYREAWAEIWNEVKDVFENAQSTGQATMKDDDCLFIKRSNFLEETYFSWSIIPLVGGDGSVKGLYNPAFEKTRRKIAERRMLTLREVGERTAAARDINGFWNEVLAALECNEFDTPFVLLYSLHSDLHSETDGDDSSTHSTSVTNSRQCYLEGALGVPIAHPASPDTIDLQSSEGFVPVFREVMKTNRSKVLDIGDGEGNIPQVLVGGLEERGFGDPLKSVVVCPIHPTTGDSTLGFLVMGINPRRPFDEDYGLFVQLLSRQLATSLASVVLFEEEIKRGQRAAKLAALDRIELSEQLAARTQEAKESETKFTRMAEFAPVGMFIANSEGLIIYCNDTWFDISRVPKGPDHTERWMDYITEDDRPLVWRLWQDLVQRTKPATAEFRFKAPWTDRNGMKGETWVLFSAYPEKTEEGKLKSVFACITNISQQKWAEGLQKKKMEEAVELKRQQENFIDVTSHEMRNPLSAILQCADEIVTSLSDARAVPDDEPMWGKVIDDNIDAAQTIALCAHHQKRIVDDVLTMSKLDSSLLAVTPIDVQPQAIVHKALKMFEGEVQTADIAMNFTVDPSFEKLGVDWVRFDPSRVLQVLINLTTNALKFTREKKGSVSITIAASLRKPSTHDNPIVSYFPSRSKRSDALKSVDWGNGEEIFIEFAVRDTGRGLTDEEKKLLPRTHVQYGGSGLGLFISRELTELQGGEIGVASEAGKGSTFAFYIKARRSSAPKNLVEHVTSRVRRNSPSASSSTSPARRKEALTEGERRASSKRPLRVLIVEDNLVNQKVLQKQLKNMGCITYVANHGGEALERLRESWFWHDKGADALQLDVILMDQEMPVMDGLTATRHIREDEAKKKFKHHVPVIAVTANARVEQVQTAMDAGMDNVVSKPFRIPDLMPKMEELVAQFIDTKF